MSPHRASVERKAEVCVLGGGPAGSVIAAQLAALGHEVILVERPSAKGPGRAESLAPSALTVLESLRLRACAEEAVLRHEERALIAWEPGDVQVRHYGAIHPLIIDRARFDALLREAAADAGVRLVAPATAHAPRRLQAGGWLIPISRADGPAALEAQFLVEARGRRSRGSRRLGERSPSMAALSGRWEAGSTNLAETRIEAGDEEWLWGCPLANPHYALTIFLEAERLAGIGKSGQERLYRTILARSRLFGGLLDCPLAGPIRACDATPHCATELAGSDFIRTGEAACSIDPLSSQGIQTALTSAIHGSAVVNTLRTGRGDPSDAIAFYRRSQARTAERSAMAAKRLYGMRATKGEKSFWWRRSIGEGYAHEKDALHGSPSVSLPPDLCLSPMLRFVEEPALVGSLIKRVPAVHHPGLTDPVAFVADVSVAHLLGEIATVSGRDQMLERLEQRVGPVISRQIMAWMYRTGIVVRQATSCRPWR